MSAELPTDIQQAFEDHTGQLSKEGQLLGRVTRVVPEQLLLVTKYTWRKLPAAAVTRIHFGYTLSERQSPEFRTLAEAEFMVWRGICHSQNLTLWGEPPKQHSLKARDIIHLGLWSHNPTHGTLSLGVFINGVNLHLQYDIPGSLKRIEPFSNLEGCSNLLAQAGGLSILQQEGPTHIRMDSRYSYLLSPTPQSVTVERFSRRQPDGRLVVPLSANLEEVAFRLFHPETIKNPVNAPVELDKSWHSADILRTLGVKWSRH